MKSTSSLKLLVAAATVAFAGSSTAAINLVGLTLPWRADPSQSADTVGGNPSWNAYVRTEDTFINSGDGSDLRIDQTLELGEYDFEIVLNHQSWVDDSVDPDSRGVYLNLFFNGLETPGISARLTGGNFGALAPLTTDQLAEVPNDLDGSPVAPAGSLSYKDGGLEVVLMEMSFSVGPDQVDAYDFFPTGANQDSYISIRLAVIPEPSAAALCLVGASSLLLRRRRR